jgi:dipeptidyl aminopeptidase/acylaminoacyl peptidase
MKSKLVVWVFFLSGYILTEAFAGQSLNQPYTIEDVLAFKRIGQVSASPDGKQVAFTVFQAQSSPSGKRWDYSLFLKDQQGRTRLLAQNGSILSLSWANDGKRIAYLAPGKKYQGLWIRDIKSRQSNGPVEFRRDIESFKWSPDGKFIGFISDNIVNHHGLDSKLINVEKQFSKKRLYLISVERRLKTSKPLTSSDYSVSDFDWHPNKGQAIAVAYQPHPGANYVNRNKISLIDLATHQTRAIPYTETHTGIQPAYSPDGRWLAFRSNVNPEKHAGDLNNDIELNGRICVTRLNSMDTYCLANTFNEDPRIIGWNASSDGIFVWDAYKTEGIKIYTLDLNPSIPAKLVFSPIGFIEPFSLTLNHSHTVFGFGYETVSDAPEAFISRTDSFTLEPVSRLQTHPGNRFLGKVEVINWKSKDHRVVEGLLMTPPGYDPQKRYPLLVNVHGGPAGVWFKRYLGGCDEYMQKMDPTSCCGNLLSIGFIILQPNPRGSGGYGKIFRSANFADFGGGDYQDVMTGVDALIQGGIADPDRLAIAGWSFGGYMSVWAISQTHRFKAAVVGAGNTDFISFSGTSDIPDYYVKYLGNPFWDDNSLYLQRAPISLVKNITTPVLILHGQDDMRVPITQAYELYTALKQQDKTVKMLISPKTGHVPTDPDVIYDNIKEVNDWLKRALETEKAKQ